MRAEPQMIRWVKPALTVLAIAILGALGWIVGQRLLEDRGEAPAAPGSQPIPVEVAPIEHGEIKWRRTYSGALEAYEIIVVAPKVSGRIDRLAVDLADKVHPKMVVAELDNAEYLQSIAQAKAELAVADANVKEAESALLIAQREFERVQHLRERGLSSDAELDSATVNHLTREASLEVAKAQQKRATATLATATIREAYTRVTVDWRGMDEERVVGQRFVNEGEIVSANTPIISVVRLDPIKAIVFATEREYSHLAVGQSIQARTEAYPGRSFPGKIRRISPVFRETSRQARVELEIDNSREELKPGMFVRVDIVLDRIEKATVVPVAALTSRDDKEGVFLVGPEGRRVTWLPVRAGIREDDRLQILQMGEEDRLPISGRVVTLGQQLLAEGSAIAIPERKVPRQEQEGR